MVEECQKKLQKELDNLRACQKEHQRAITKRQQLDAQLNENNAVKNELDLMKEDGEVYKLIGPVLVKQDLEEAKQNVSKRMDYITGELKRLDEGIATIEKRQEGQRETLTTLQKQLSQLTMKGCVKA